MDERIYIRGEGGRLEALKEERFENEKDLQVLLADHPELLDGEQMRPDQPRRWAFISREMGIPEEPDESDRWFVDHLLVDQDAWPTLVECKRSVDSASRRRIVGQLLEYAAHASKSWTADGMRERFEAHCQARGLVPTAELANRLGIADTDVDGFFQEVARNLDAHRMRLLFVADEIPDPLLRVIEFLNQQMQDVEVLAVAIKQFGSASTKTFVPRVLGRTAKASRHATSGRETNAVFTLVEQKILPNDEPFTFDVRALRSWAREGVSAWIEEKPNRGRATWQNDRQRPLKWAENGKSYSVNGLTETLLRDAESADMRARITEAWQTKSGESLKDLAARARLNPQLTSHDSPPKPPSA